MFCARALEYSLRLIYGLAGWFSGVLLLGKRLYGVLSAPATPVTKFKFAVPRSLPVMMNQARKMGAIIADRVAFGHGARSTDSSPPLPPITFSRLRPATLDNSGKERILALTVGQSDLTYLCLDADGETYASGSVREPSSRSLLQTCSALAKEHLAQRILIRCCDSSSRLDFVRWAQLIEIPRAADMVFFSHSNLRSGNRDWVLNHRGELGELSTLSSWPIVLGDHQTNVVPGLPFLCTVDLLEIFTNKFDTKVEDAQAVQELSLEAISMGGHIWENNVPDSVSVERCQAGCALSFPTRPALVARNLGRKNLNFMDLLKEHRAESCCSICYTTSFETVAPSKDQDNKVALLVSPYPTHPIEHGNRKRMVDLGEALQREGYRTIFAFSPELETSETHVDEMKAFWGTIEVLPPSTHPAHDYGTLYDSWINPKIPGITRSLCINERVDVVICSYVWMSKLLCGVPAYCKKVIDTHDRMTGRFASLEEIGLEPNFFSCTDEDEAKYLSRADTVIAISREDQQWFQSLNSGAKVEMISYLEEPRRSWQRRNSDILTFGLVASSNSINVRSLQELLESMLSRSDSLPYQLSIAGGASFAISSQTKKQVLNRFPEKVEFLGFVKDLENFYSGVDAVVAPLMFGTGMSIKSLEPIFLGLPLISTEAGTRGIPTNDPDHCLSSVHLLERRLKNINEMRLEELAELSLSLAHDIHTSSLTGLRKILP